MARCRPRGGRTGSRGRRRSPARPTPHWSISAIASLLGLVGGLAARHRLRVDDDLGAGPLLDRVDHLLDLLDRRAVEGPRPCRRPPGRRPGRERRPGRGDRRGRRRGRAIAARPRAASARAGETQPVGWRRGRMAERYAGVGSGGRPPPRRGGARGSGGPARRPARSARSWASGRCPGPRPRPRPAARRPSRCRPRRRASPAAAIARPDRVGDGDARAPRCAGTRRGAPRRSGRTPSSTGRGKPRRPERGAARSTSIVPLRRVVDAAGS